MKKQFLIILTVFGLLFILTVFTNKAHNIGIRKTILQLKETKVSTGKEIFLQNCAACHKTDLTGNPPAIPALTDIAKKYDKNGITEIVVNGKNAMPSFRHLSDKERNAVVNFLFGEESTVSIDQELTSIERGRRLFVANCTNCHKINEDDPEPPGIKDYGMKPAVLG